MSTNSTPLTTLPLSTSRQGMTRLSSTSDRHRQGVPCLAYAEAPFIERLPGDHAGQLLEPQLLEGPQVFQRAHSARVEEAAPDRGGHAPHLLRVRPLQHPVAIRVRVHEQAGPEPLQLAEDVLRRRSGRLRPAGHGHLAATYVDGDHDPGAPGAERLLEEGPVAERGG